MASSEKRQPNLWNVVIVTAIFAVILLVFPNVLQERMYHPILQSLENRGWASLIVKPSLLWLSLGMALLTIRTLLWTSLSSRLPAFRLRTRRPG